MSTATVPKPQLIIKRINVKIPFQINRGEENKTCNLQLTWSIAIISFAAIKFL